MTIEGLNNFINKKYPNLKNEISINKFTGKRIAIDFYNWMYCNYQSVYSSAVDGTDIINETIDNYAIEKMYLSNLIKFIIKWASNQITPIIILDGKEKDMKSKTHIKRKVKRTKILHEIEELYKLLEDKMKDDILEPIDHITIKIKTKLKSLAKIPKKIIELSIDFFKSIGIPCIEAKGDAEKLCAILCREKIVAGVFSKDIDCLAFGSPIMLKEFSKTKNKTPLLVCLKLDQVLEEFKMSFNEFLDFCILCGCDYNDKIDGLGPIGAYKQIFDNKRIENIDSKYDYTPLNHEVIRNEFKIISSNDLIYLRHSNFQSDNLYEIQKIQNLELFDEYELDNELIFLVKTLNYLIRYNQPGHSIEINYDAIKEIELSELKQRKAAPKKALKKKV